MIMILEHLMMITIPVYADISILEKEEVAFIKYILEGIRNVGYLMNVKFEDIERLCRRRNISNAEKLEQIRAICTAGKDNNDLLNGCVEDISDMVSENTPEDFWDFLEDYTKKKEDENDAESQQRLQKSQRQAGRHASQPICRA